MKKWFARRRRNASVAFVFACFLLLAILYACSRDVVYDRGRFMPFCFRHTVDRGYYVVPSADTKAAGSIVIIVPVTSRGFESSLNSSCVYVTSLPLFRVLFASLVETITPERTPMAGVMVAVSVNDLLASQCRSEFIQAVHTSLKQYYSVHFVWHNRTRLVDMYNDAALAAHRVETPRYDYFAIGNDDLRYQTVDWTVALTRKLHDNDDFGVISPREYWMGHVWYVGVDVLRFVDGRDGYKSHGCSGCTGYNVVSRHHIDVFGHFFEPAIQNFGIDSHQCEIYHFCNANLISYDTFVKNHCTGDDDDDSGVKAVDSSTQLPRRYAVDVTGWYSYKNYTMSSIASAARQSVGTRHEKQWTTCAKRLGLDY